MYLPNLMCNSQMFDNIPIIKIGDIMLRPINTSQIKLEAKNYNIVSSNSLVEKFVPGAYTTYEAAAYRLLYDFMEKRDAKISVLFCISLLNNNPLGYIECNSPLLRYEGGKQEIGNWTITFWLHEKARGRGFMTLSIKYILDHMQKMQIPRVFAFVDKSNTKCISVLKDCSMKVFDETADNKMFIFGVNLND